jgi:hypothetical protein
VLTAPISLLTESIEVKVFSKSGGPTLVGAVELVSPANKDRPSHRNAFVTKCAALIQQGIGLIIVDAVTERRANFHADLLTRLGVSDPTIPDADLYATAYRPVQQDEEVQLAVWQEVLQIGATLPTLPLWLRQGPCLRVDLEASYERTCSEQRILTNGSLLPTS